MEETTPQASQPSKQMTEEEQATVESEANQITQLIEACSKQAAKLALRAVWRKCLIGDDKHHSFCIRAILKHSSPHVFKRVAEVYGDQLLEVASDDFLDKAFEKRLQTIPATALVALLAKAKRLGFEDDDGIDYIGDEELVHPSGASGNASETDSAGAAALSRGPANGAIQDTAMYDRAVFDQGHIGYLQNALVHQPHFLPVAPMVPAPALLNSHAPSPQVAALHDLGPSSAPPAPTTLEATTNGNQNKFSCTTCGKVFITKPGYDYHLQKQVCLKPPRDGKYNCQLCAKSFATNQGRVYHELTQHCQAKQGEPVGVSPSLLSLPSHAASISAPGGPPIPSPPRVPSSAPPRPATTLRSTSGGPNNGRPVNWRPNQTVDIDKSNSSTPVHDEDTADTMESTASGAPTRVLTPAERLDMDNRIAEEGNKLQSLINAVEANPDLSDQKKKDEILRLRRNSASHKTIIRRKFGQTVNRRTSTPNASGQTSGQTSGQELPFQALAEKRKRKSGSSTDHKAKKQQIEVHDAMELDDLSHPERLVVTDTPQMLSSAAAEESSAVDPASTVHGKQAPKTKRKKILTTRGGGYLSLWDKQQPTDSVSASASTIATTTATGNASEHGKLDKGKEKELLREASEGYIPVGADTMFATPSQAVGTPATGQRSSGLFIQSAATSPDKPAARRNIISLDSDEEINKPVANREIEEEEDSDGDYYVRPPAPSMHDPPSAATMRASHALDRPTTSSSSTRVAGSSSSTRVAPAHRHGQATTTSRVPPSQRRQKPKEIKDTPARPLIIGGVSIGLAATGATRHATPPSSCRPVKRSGPGGQPAASQGSPTSPVAPGKRPGAKNVPGGPGMGLL